MRSTIYFDGKSSADFGLIVEYFPESVHAARRGELIPIPGRNGVIVREDGAFDTYSQQYQVWFRNTMGRDTYQKARDVAEWLLSASGFCRLEDTYEPEHFRLARFVGPLNIETVLCDHGRATLEFDVQPQRYLKSGETPISYEGDSTTTFSITNPTLFEARPLLKFVDTSVEPPTVSQSIVVRNNTLIWQNGEVINWKPSWSGGEDPEVKTCEPVSVSGFAYAYVTGNSYAFYDGSGNALTFDADYYKTHQTNMDNTKVIVPSNASTIVIGTGKGAPDMSLSLQEARANPGNSAVTINGTTISLDFSEHDTIFLDCDLHDAYYIDGSSANNKVSFANNFDPYPTFPGLLPGENTIIPGDGSNLDFELTPRWWTL